MTKKPNIYEILRINPSSSKIEGVFIENEDELRKLIETEYAKKNIHVRNYTKVPVIVIYLRVEESDCLPYTDSTIKAHYFPEKISFIIAEYTIIEVHFDYDETNTLRADFATPIRDSEYPIAYIIPYKQSMHKVENALEEIHAYWRD